MERDYLGGREETERASETKTRARKCTNTAPTCLEVATLGRGGTGGRGGWTGVSVAGW